MNRRHVLRGMGGVVVGLPFLESLAPGTTTRGAHAATAAVPPFAIFVRQGNGVQQQNDIEPERFWPTALGPLTTATLGDRAVSELRDHASRLLIVKSIKYPAAFKDSGCAHSGCGNIAMTASPPSVDPRGNKSLATGESLDNRIARELHPGVEPLTLYAGPKGGYIDEVLSYRGSLQLRAAENNPWNAYQRLFGMTGMSAAESDRLAIQRKSVNDLVRRQMQRLMSWKGLASSDRQRLDLHFSSIRDLETKMLCSLTEAQQNPIKQIAAKANSDDATIEVAKMQMDIIALAISCGKVRTATLQIGTGNDGIQYTIDGVKLPRYHQISHRIFGDGGEGAPIPDAALLHHKVDRLMARTFKHLLDRLVAYKVDNGNLLDHGVAIWMNDMANGGHERHNLPFVLAGTCGGYLKTGAYVDAGGDATNNKFLNTIGAAVGCKNAAGAPLDDFGDASLAKGHLAAIKA